MMFSIRTFHVRQMGGQSLSRTQIVYRFQLRNVEVSWDYGRFTSIMHGVHPLFPWFNTQLGNCRLCRWSSTSDSLLDLPFFRSPSYRGQLGQASEEVQSALAPYALLVMCLRPFIILSRRVQALLNDRRTSPRRRSSLGNRTSGLEIKKTTLAFWHLTGIREHGKGGDHIGEAVLLCLSTIWTAIVSHGGEDKFKKPVAVKMEQL